MNKANKTIKVGFIVLASSLIITVLFLGIKQAASAESHPEIVYFYDGDTVKIKDGNSIYKLRITEMDAPERTQSYGLKARRALMKLCEKAEINVIISGIDKYQRQLGQLYCNSQSVAHYMVANGYAWSEGKYANNQSILIAEKNAQANKLGLWQDDNAMPPWLWRKKGRH